MPADRSLRRRELIHHGARIAVSVVALAIAHHVGCDAIAVVASAAFVFACFGLGHDLMHGVLALPRAVSSALLSSCHLVMLSSGHGVKATHAMHHRAPLSDGDAEGRAARRSFLGAVVWAPADLWSVRIAGFRLAPRRDRWLVVAENVASLLVVAALAAFEAGRIHLVVALALQLSIGVWASHIPHHLPAWLCALARPFARGPSLVARSLVFHDLHHARPDVPSAWLGRLAAVAMLAAGCAPAESRAPSARPVPEASSGSASAPAPGVTDAFANREVADDVAATHDAIVKGDVAAMDRVMRRMKERSERALGSGRELPLARALRARFGAAGLVEELHVHIEQSTYRAGVLLEGRYVLRVRLPVAHDGDGGRVRASGPAEVALVELTAVCERRHCPGVEAAPDDDRLSIFTGPEVALDVAAVLAPSASLADWLGHPPLVGVPVDRAAEAMRSTAGLDPLPSPGP